MLHNTSSPPLISVVTVVFNDQKHIEETLLSVINQTYSNIEYIVIDGGSNDGTVDIIKKYESFLSYWVSEKDDGIYNAMNKGIKVARGAWINFMNCGDVFFDNDVLENISKHTEKCSLIYSDVFLSNGRILSCNISNNMIAHQSLVYKIDLHSIYGLYFESRFISISDYMFFMQCKNEKWKKVEFVIAKFDQKGTSSKNAHFKQRIAVDVLFGNISRFKAALCLLAHPMYNKVKRLFI